MAVLARRGLEPDVLLHPQRQGLGAPPASCSSPTPRSARTPSTSATARRTSTASSPRATPTTSTTASTTCATRTTTSSGSSGHKIGSLRNVPFPIRKLERIYKFTSAKGSAWPHDIALTDRGRPRVVYTRRVDHRDTFFYAYHNGERWISREIVGAGPGFPSFTSGGATLDHEDPRVVYLSRRTGDFHQVEAWFTPDDGRTWRSRRLTDEPSHYCIRPVTPRGLKNANLVLFARGDRSTKGFTDFRTRIHALGGFSPPV